MSANNKTVSGLTNNSAAVARWIYRTTEGNIGPIDTKEFLALVQSGTILPQTLVRLSDSTQWMAASEIGGIEFPATSISASATAHPETDSITKEQLVAHNREMQRLFLECVDRQRASVPAPRRVSTRSSSVHVELPFKGFFSSVFSFVSDKISSAFESCVSLTGRAASFFRQAVRSRVVWFSVALLLLVVILNPKFPTYWITQRQIHSALQKTVAELKDLRSKHADDATWNEFQQRSAKKLADFIPTLSSAPVENHNAMSLLFATKNLLPPLLEDRDGKDVETQKLVETILVKVDESFQKPIDMEKVSTTLMIGLDVVVVCAALMYFGRGWISRGIAAR